MRYSIHELMSYDRHVAQALLINEILNLERDLRVLRAAITRPCMN